jgi:hypothetical protein
MRRGRAFIWAGAGARSGTGGCATEQAQSQQPERDVGIKSCSGGGGGGGGGDGGVDHGRRRGSASGGGGAIAPGNALPCGSCARENANDSPALSFVTPLECSGACTAGAALLRAAATAPE